MPSSVRIPGISDTLTRLGEFKKSTSRAILERALKRAAKPIADAAKSAAPVKTGRLRASIKTAVVHSSPGKAAYAAAIYDAQGQTALERVVDFSPVWR